MRDSVASPTSIPFFGGALVGEEEAVDRAGRAQKPHILYLAYHFPPKRGIACVRTTNTAAHLAGAGWNLTVVTPYKELWREKEENHKEPSCRGVEVLRTGFAFPSWEYSSLHELNNGWQRWVGGVMRKLLKRFDPSYDICWTKALRQSYSRLKGAQFDVILATGAPWTAFRCARELSELTGRPYVLDYRDLWTVGNPYGTNLSKKARRIETELFRGSSAVTVVSEGMRETLVEEFGERSKVHVVTNGFNPDEFTNIHPAPFTKPALVYAGSLAKPKRILDPVLLALQRMKAASGCKPLDLVLRYHGPNGDLVSGPAQELGISDLVEVRGSTGRGEALGALKAAHLVVVVTSVLDESSPGIRGVVTGKLFEALALGRPILLIAPPGGDAEKIMGEHGVRCAGTDVDSICEALKVYLHTWHGPYAPPESYSWASVAGRMSLVLREASQTPQK